jgi:hypothetical protein
VKEEDEFEEVESQNGLIVTEEDEFEEVESRKRVIRQNSGGACYRFQSLYFPSV